MKVTGWIPEGSSSAVSLEEQMRGVKADPIRVGATEPPRDTVGPRQPWDLVREEHTYLFSPHLYNAGSWMKLSLRQWD